MTSKAVDVRAKSNVDILWRSRSKRKRVLAVQVNPLTLIALVSLAPYTLASVWVGKSASLPLVTQVINYGILIRME